MLVMSMAALSLLIIVVIWVKKGNDVMITKSFSPTQATQVSVVEIVGPEHIARDCAAIICKEYIIFVDDGTIVPIDEAENVYLKEEFSWIDLTGEVIGE